MTDLNTFGGTIKLEGEKEYRSAISQINSDLKVFSSELSKLSVEFGKNTTSMQGLTEKNKVLTEQIVKQKEKIATLKGVVEESAEKYGEHDKKTNNWQISLNKAEAELVKMEKELESNTDQINENKKNLGEGTKSLDEFGKKEEEAGRKALSFGDLVKANLVSDAIINGVKKLGEAVSQIKDYLVDSISAAASYADNILALSTQTGISTLELQKYSAVAELVDVSTEMMTGSMAKNIKSMSSAANGSKTMVAAYKKLGVSVTDSNGKLRDGEQVYWEIIDALKKIPNETERDSVAMQILGKSAQDLNPLIAQGSAGIAEITSQCHSWNAVLSDEMLNSLGTLDDSMQIWKSTTASTANVLGAAFAPALTTVTSGANGLVGAFNRLVNSVIADDNVFEEELKNFSSMASDFAQSLLQGVPELLEVGKSLISALLQGLTTAFPTILDASVKIIPEIVSGVTSVLPQLMDAAVQIITALSTALINSLPQIIEAAIQIIVSLAKGLTDALPSLIPPIMDAVVLIAESLIENIDLIIEAGVGLLMGLVQAIPQIVSILTPKVPEIITSIVDALIENIPVLLDAAIQLFGALVQAIPQITAVLIENMPQILGVLVDGLKRLPELWGAGFNVVLENLKSWFGEAISTAIAKTTEFVDSIINFFKELPGKIWEWLQNTGFKISVFFGNAINIGKTKAGEFLNNVVEVIKNLPSRIWQWLENAVKNVVSWGSDMVEKGETAAKDLFNAIVDKIKEIPQKMFSIGRDIVHGIWNGISNAIGWITDKVKSFAKGILGGIKSTLGIASPSKVFREQVGKNIALGIGEGFSHEMKIVQKEMQNAIPTDFSTDVNMAIDQANSSVDAFKNPTKNTSFADNFKNAVDITNSKISEKLDSIFYLLQDYIPALQKRQLCLDTGVLVGELTPSINTELSRIGASKERGR